MKKQEIIKELHDEGYLWANEGYSKKELEDFLDGVRAAQAMDFGDLKAYINGTNDKIARGYSFDAATQAGF